MTFLRNAVRRIVTPVYDWSISPRLRYSKYYAPFARSKFYADYDSLLASIMAFVAAERVEGDYLEFGVFQGGTFSRSYYAARRAGLARMKFYAFDSFQGLPAPTAIDEGGPFAVGEFPCDLPTFRGNLRRHGVRLDDVTAVPGWFSDSLTEETRRTLPLQRAAVVWVDCDLYESTVPVLKWITPYLQDGTILVFDDWFCFKGDPGKGEQLAFREWLNANPGIQAREFHRMLNWRGNSFIISKPAATAER
jgi:O-methyltransferase